MARRGKIVLAVLLLGSVLGLIAATNAWFIAVSSTPPGTIQSALVRYLPDGGARSLTSLLTHGNLISGSGVDPDGVPLILPGDRLLSSSTVADGTETVRTSIARAFEAGETVDTLIHWDIRTVNGVEYTYKQRDLMQTNPPVDEWFKVEDTTESKVDPPTLIGSQYDISTTSDETVVRTTTTTTTTTLVVTTYDPRVLNLPAYRHKVTTVRVVTHEGATITPTLQSADWAAALPVLTATETVLFVPVSDKPALANLPTRSYLSITRSSGDGNTPAGTTLPIPLALDNLSTVDSRLRIGLVAYLEEPDKAPLPLTLVGPVAAGSPEAGNYYLGTTTGGTFIELLVFRPHVEAGQYHWQKVTETGDNALWSLWDLTLDEGNTTIIPPLPSPVVDPAAPPADAAPAATYTVTELLGIVSKPSPLSTVANKTFEELFNLLYCDNVPTITVRLSYYMRQSDYMEWNEFYSQDLSLSMGDYS